MDDIIEIFDSKYREHKVFIELKVIIEFYDFLSQTSFNWIEPGSKTIFGLNSRVFASIEGTLESILSLLSNGRINDSYALVRKYHDSIIISSYIITYADIKKDEGYIIIEQVENWVSGKENLPKYNIMKQFLGKANKLQAVTALIEKDKRYVKIRERCNDHMHYNFFYFMQANNNTYYSDKRIKSLDQILNDVRDIFILHFAYVFSINDHYLLADDYVDYLEENITPPEGSEKFVAPIAQEIFDGIIKRYREDIAELIKSSTDFELK